MHSRIVVFRSRETCCMLVRLNLEVPTILIFTVSHLFVPSLAPLVFPWSLLIGVSLLARSSLFSRSICLILPEAATGLAIVELSRRLDSTPGLPPFGLWTSLRYLAARRLLAGAAVPLPGSGLRCG